MCPCDYSLENDGKKEQAQIKGRRYLESQHRVKIQGSTERKDSIREVFADLSFTKRFTVSEATQPQGNTQTAPGFPTISAAFIVKRITL